MIKEKFLHKKLLIIFSITFIVLLVVHNVGFAQTPPVDCTPLCWDWDQEACVPCSGVPLDGGLLYLLGGGMILGIRQIRKNRKKKKQIN
jgi:hypothetical protein